MRSGADHMPAHPVYVSAFFCQQALREASGPSVAIRVFDRVDITIPPGFSPNQLLPPEATLVPSCRSSRNRSFAVAARKSLLSRARQQAVRYVNLCNLVLVTIFRSEQPQDITASIIGYVTDGTPFRRSDRSFRLEGGVNSLPSSSSVPYTSVGDRS